ncbi:hypothetical protein WN51_05617 [Melipona quadrifasciata]|uniref:Uncharacterized protein n=1 Tax=Melipona quadrifasciata TaxID=166423 RepID=A0A0N0BCT2_9HYME|nr:hypothetical protein WN51_05617 [Melipona quadrifasciata]
MRFYYKNKRSKDSTTKNCKIKFYIIRHRFQENKLQLCLIKDRLTISVLMPADFKWVPARHGHVPPHAVEAGRTINGEMLYIGRAYQNGVPCVGKCYYYFGTAPVRVVEEKPRCEELREKNSELRLVKRVSDRKIGAVILLRELLQIYEQDIHMSQETGKAEPEPETEILQSHDRSCREITITDNEYKEIREGRVCGTPLGWVVELALAGLVTITQASEVEKVINIEREMKAKECYKRYKKYLNVKMWRKREKKFFTHLNLFTYESLYASDATKCQPHLILVRENFIAKSTMCGGFRTNIKDGRKKEFEMQRRKNIRKSREGCKGSKFMKREGSKGNVADAPRQE